MSIYTDHVQVRKVYLFTGGHRESMRDSAGLICVREMYMYMYMYMY